jgi:predicted amidohydrolase
LRVAPNRGVSRTVAHWYPPRDLLEKPSFVERAGIELKRLAEETSGLDTTIVTGPSPPLRRSSGKSVVNCAVVLRGGRILFTQHKMLLPTYDVFDEARYSCRRAPVRRRAGGAARGPHQLRGRLERQAVLGAPPVPARPVEELAAAGARSCRINASPYHKGKRELRRDVFAATARKYGVPVVYVNQVGGNDQLVFDGSSFALDADARVIASARSFAEDLVFVDTKPAMATCTKTWRMKPRPSTKRWLPARGTTSASAASSACSSA